MWPYLDRRIQQELFLQVIHDLESLLTGEQPRDEEPHLLRGWQGLLLAITLIRLNALDL